MAMHDVAIYIPDGMLEDVLGSRGTYQECQWDGFRSRHAGERDLEELSAQWKRIQCRCRRTALIQYVRLVDQRVGHHLHISPGCLRQSTRTHADRLQKVCSKAC